MDYGIYKTIEAKKPQLLHRFLQKDTNHRALAHAKQKLLEMWAYTLSKTYLMKNAKSESRYAFSYEHITSVYTSTRIRIHIEPIKQPKQ